MASLTLADVNDIAKEVYSSRRLQPLAIAKRPLLNWISKKEKMGGTGYAVPVWYEDPQSVGTDLATLITNQENSRQTRFFIDDDNFAALYGVVAITGKALLGTRSDLFAFMRGKDMQVKGMVRQLGKRLHENLYKSGDGELARAVTIADSGATGVITFTNKSDVNYFGVGMTVRASANADGSSPRAGTNVKVTKVSRSAGTVTVNATVVATHSWGNTDYLFVSGDEGTNAQVKGLAAWLPLAEPSATTFYGVDRTQHATRLSGHRVDQSGQEIIQSLHQLATLIGEAEGSPDAVFIHPLAGDVLADQIGAKVERLDGKKAEVQFDGFRLHHFITGPIDFIFDWACPSNRAYMLQQDTWELVHMGDLPHIIADDGQMAVRGATTDDIQLRGRLFAQPVCYYPGANGVCSIAIS